jgi:hypothetical protein
MTPQFYGPRNARGKATLTASSRANSVNSIPRPGMKTPAGASINLLARRHSRLRVDIQADNQLT